MKMRAALSMSLSLLVNACRVSAPVVVAVVGASSMAACADESDPATWAKRLDDPAQRSAAVKRLDEMFNGAMGQANNNREDAKVKAVIDPSVDALTKTYTTQQLDEKTRKDLIKLIADMADPRGTAAFAKAFKDYEPGKNDEDVKFAAQGTGRLSTAGKLSDQNLIDALWDCFAKFKPSQAKSINLVKDLQGAIKTVKSPTWGPKAVVLLAAPVPAPITPDVAMDQIQFLQLTAVQLIGDTKFAGGVKPLIQVLMTPTKKDLIFPVRTALLKMPKDSEPELIKALRGEADYKAQADAYPERGYLPLIAEPLGYISRPNGQAAIIEQLKTDLNPQNRTALAIYLTYYPTSPATIAAYRDAYAKVPADASIALMGGSNGKALLTSASANFFDPSFTEWIIKEIAAAKGDAADQMPSSSLPSAIKLMTNAQEKMVNDAVNKIVGVAIEKDMYKSASAVLDKCTTNVDCYLGVLDTPVPSAPPAAKTGHVKAIWMAVENAKPDTKGKLADRIDKIKDPSVRLALLEAIDNLSPQGDAAIADKLEKISEVDRAAGNAGADEMYRIALKLRARVP